MTRRYFDFETIPFYYEMTSLCIWAIVHYPIFYIIFLLIISSVELTARYFTRKYPF
ncbi:hypothetical protein NBO_60g0026 [Nosema bombycis CQ1]|uniref:Uncharacterized protein n=1 Tax=Nosema bombycis (strain CQ1 / CVCC 102059) TaxID=578461 RepID=R0MHZ0_NOSB1|nr:hypothetical protein NBO_60g0026 [Nosema bombycis CQ1]|eukprot:EOB13770.1 hypothetical protein NBO_60g0026 [Nosema bombycis CQ1]